MNPIGMDIDKVTETLEKYKSINAAQKGNLEKMQRTFSKYLIGYQSTNNEKMENIQNKLAKNYRKIIEDTDIIIKKIELYIEDYKNTNQSVLNTLSIENEIGGKNE